MGDRSIMNCKDVEGSDTGLILDTAPTLPGGTEENHETLRISRSSGRDLNLRPPE
jgi:hypothetical protein